MSGNAVQVTQTTGTATVDFSPKTKVTEWTTAQLTDIATGNCVNVVAKPGSGSGNAVTAAAVQVTPPGADGKCPQPKNGPHRDVVGTVASMAGNTINVTVTDANGNPSQTDVTVTDKTQYTKDASANSQAIAQGKCITARGKKDGGGTLQARRSSCALPTTANARSLPVSSIRTNDRSTNTISASRGCAARCG